MNSDQNKKDQPTSASVKPDVKVEEKDMPVKTTAEPKKD